MVMLVVPLGLAFAKINECPPQQQPTGNLFTECTRGGEGGPGGGSGGQTERSIDENEEQPALQGSVQERGGGGGPGGGGGGNSSGDVTLVNLFDFDADVEAAGGNSETGGGHCGETFEDGKLTDEFQHGKDCPEFPSPIFIP
jgi:hypothetical protein